MCGRYTQILDTESLQARFAFEPTSISLTPRYNMAPGQDGPVVTADEPGGGRQLRLLRWGLVPHWAKDEKIGYRMINARAETVDQKPSFKGLLTRRRCLVLAGGFYEWTKPAEGRSKTPYYFYLKGNRPFALAGLWDRWSKGEGQALETYTIITTRANELVALVHDRMPVILRREDENLWLDPGLVDPVRIRDLLKPFSAGDMDRHEVSTTVNRPSNEGPSLIEPVGE